MKWLVFSDLHKAIHNYVSEEGRGNLFDKIVEINNEGKVDFVLFTGDFFNKGIGNKEEIVNFVNKIMGKLSPQTNFFMCPGNHDIQRIEEGDRKKVIDGIRENNVALELDKIPYRDAYRKFQDLFYDLYHDLYVPFKMYENNNYTITRIDTCLCSNDKFDEGKLYVMFPELSNIKAPKSKLNIVIMHHSASFFNKDEQMRFAHWLRNHNMDVVFCGHSHIFEARRIPETARNDVQIFEYTCGALHKEPINTREQKLSFLECIYLPTEQKILTTVYCYDQSEKWKPDTSFSDGLDYRLTWKKSIGETIENSVLPCTNVYTNISQIDFQKEIQNTTSFMYFGIKGDRTYYPYDSLQDMLNHNRGVECRFLITDPNSPYWINRVPSLKLYSDEFDAERHFADVYDTLKKMFECCQNEPTAQVRFHKEPLRFRLYIFDSKLFFSLYSDKHSVDSKIYVFSKELTPRFYNTFKDLFEDYWKRYEQCDKFPDTKIEYNHFRHEFPITPSLVINVGSNCNLKCIYCPDGGENLKPIEHLVDIEKIKWLMREHLYRLETHIQPLGKGVIRFTGGEPLLEEKRMVSLLEEIVAINIEADKKESLKYTKIVIDTNGTPLLDFYNNNKKLLKQLKDYLLFKISLDSLRIETLKKITRNRNVKMLKQIQKAIETLSEQGFRIELNTVLQEENLSEIGDIYQYAKDNNLVGVKVLSIHNMGQGTITSSTSKSINEMMRIMKSLVEKPNHVESYPYLNSSCGIRMYRICDVESNGCSLTFVNHEYDSAPRTFSTECINCQKYEKCGTGIMSIVLRADGLLSLCRDAVFNNVLDKQNNQFNIAEEDNQGISRAMDVLMDKYKQCKHIYRAKHGE